MKLNVLNNINGNNKDDNIDSNIINDNINSNNINSNINSNNINSNNNNIIIDTTSQPDKAVDFEKKLAKSIFCIVHFIVYCIIIFRKGTILDQAFKDNDYFYLIWTHCVFLSAIGSYFVVSSSKPGFVSLNNSHNNTNNSNSFVFEESIGCIPKLNYNINSNNRKLKNSGGSNKDDNNNNNNSKDDLVPLINENSNNDNISNNQEDEEQQQDINSNNNNYSNNNEIDKLKTNYFCKKCFVDIPLRTKHCVKCNRCVLKYDHHCVFIGGCVGLNNHKQFLTFLLVESLLLLLGLRIIVTGFVYENTIKEWVMSNIAIIPPTLLIFGGLMMPLVLFLFHSFLVLTNQSSWEFNKYQRITYLKPFAKRGINPFNKGVWNNLKKFLKGDEKPSDWVLLSKKEVDQIKKKQENSFNIWNNKYYSCCG